MFAWDLFWSFKVCSGAKGRVGCGKQLEATAPIQSLVKLQPWFLSLRLKTFLRQNYSLGSCACSERPCPWTEHCDDDDVMNAVFFTLEESAALFLTAWIDTVSPPQFRTHLPVPIDTQSYQIPFQECWSVIILVATLSSRGRGFTSSENRTNHSCSYNVVEYKSNCSSLLVRELKYYVRP